MFVVVNLTDSFPYFEKNAASLKYFEINTTINDYSLSTSDD